MKIRAPLHSIDVRGRFAVGLVFSNWKGLSYARSFTVPVNPRSTRQVVIRGLITTASRAWAGLTDANRTSFETYAAGLSRKNVFGQDVKTSGFNEYVALSVMAQEVGETPVSTAPSTAAPAIVTDGAAAEGAASGQITVTWTDGQGGYVDVGITGLLGDGQQPQESDYTHDSYTADATGTLTISDLAAGGKYSVRFRQVFANGQTGPYTVSTLTAKA